MRLLFLADLHLLPGPRPEQNAALAAFLRGPAAAADAVYFLGDVFHFWFERGDRCVGNYAEVLALLREAAGRTRLHHLIGNRDFATGPVLAARSGMTCHGAWRLAETGGERLLLGHGDRLCTRDWSYQALRWTLTGPLGRAVRRWTPWPLARRLVERVQERPKVPFCHTPLGEHDIQAPAAAAALAAHGADHLVCGHLHVPEDRRLRPGDPQPRLHILPAWRNDRGWLSWEAGAFARHRP